MSLKSYFVMGVLLTGLTLCAVATAASINSQDKKDIVDFYTTEEAALPPDTFRKLAQALYQRGDKAENRMHRKFFYNSNVTCNDGSVAGYYIRRNYHSKRWIVFLEGGWICHDDLSCSHRHQRERFRMSSDQWPSVRAVGGILSADPKENPDFADANHVFVPYCSSDSWSGTNIGAKKGSTAFMGNLIVQEVIRELADYNQLLFAKELYLAGSSAGATGVLVNVDLVAKMVAKVGILVRGIVDSGWFLDNQPFAGDCPNGQCHSVIDDLKAGVELWGAKVPEECLQEYPERWQCFIGYKAFPFIQSPIFIIQWQFDKFQMYADNVAIPSTPEHWNFIHRMGKNLRTTYQSLSAVFSPACIAHEIITSSDWTQVAVEGVTLSDALSCWAAGLPDTVPDSLAGSPDVSALGLEIRSQFASDDNLIISDLKDKGVLFRGLESVQADQAAKPEYKLARNLVRSIGRTDEEDALVIPNPSESGSSSPQRNQIKNRRRKKHRRVDHNRTSGRQSSKRSRRHRLMKRCRENNQEACRKLHKATHSRRKNSDLVRSLDRRSSRRGSKRRLSPEERRKRKARRQAQKRERRERKRAHKRLLRERRRQQRQRFKEMDAAAAAKAKAHSVKTRSVSADPQQPKCKAKLVDNCTWPHCNRSCPKLKNPETGHEIDFLTLLRSFGLDMTSVARALGVDIQTLNNMDRDILLHLLTSQSSN